MLIQNWHIWFAWYPVKIENRTVWLRKVERKNYMYKSNEWSEYRELVKM